ncbi:hypothetical protein AX17_001873 [Amanita inopinata Kibby_2008]|nr:hypothetical protein AX17_001873 [Amanita inopinata Kibby_2008]
MLFAPYGVRVVSRKALSHTNQGVNVSKSSHIWIQPSIPRTQTLATGRLMPSNVLQSTCRLFTHSHSFLSRFFTRLLSPGLRIPVSSSLSGRSLHSAVSHARMGRAAIKQGFSFPVYNALARPSGIGTFFPRAPLPSARVATNLGLGTVRKFSSARPLFQNLVENVPIVVRALYESDIDGIIPVKVHSMKRPTTSAKRKETSKHRSLTFPIRAVEKQMDAPLEELDHYFSVPAVTPVTTYMLVPLAPTPTSRMPLELSPPNALAECPSLVHPLAELSSLHMSHELHALRVSSLFARLDHGDVWSRGVRCSAFAHGNVQALGSDGPCTILVLEFIGWSKAEVKGIIGEAGTGWCILHEECHDETGGTESDISSEISGLDENYNTPDPDDAQNFFLPNLDLSSSPDNDTSTSERHYTPASPSHLFLNSYSFSSPEFDPQLSLYSLDRSGTGGTGWNSADDGSWSWLSSG